MKEKVIEYGYEVNYGEQNLDFTNNYKNNPNNNSMNTNT